MIHTAPTSSKHWMFSVRKADWGNIRPNPNSTNVECIASKTTCYRQDKEVTRDTIATVFIDSRTQKILTKGHRDMLTKRNKALRVACYRVTCLVVICWVKAVKRRLPQCSPAHFLPSSIYSGKKLFQYRGDQLTLIFGTNPPSDMPRPLSDLVWQATGPLFSLPTA